MINFKMIGQRIKEGRKEKGFTQETFSEMIDISIEHLSRIENGAYRPSLSLIEKICTVLETTEEELMFGTKSEAETAAKLANKIACLPSKKQQAIENIIDLISE